MLIFSLKEKNHGEHQQQISFGNQVRQIRVGLQTNS